MRFIVLTLFALAAYGQQTKVTYNPITHEFNSAFKPTITGDHTTLACTPGVTAQLYESAAYYDCTATNTWTLRSSGSATVSSVVIAGTTNKITVSGTCTITTTGTCTITIPDGVVLVGPVLGTVAAGSVLTNATGLPTAGMLDAAVTLQKMADLANARVICRTTAGTGVPESCTGAQILAIDGGGLPAGNVTTTFSATPTFTCPSSTAGTIVNFKLSTAMSANITSSTLASCTTGSILNFTFTQAASGGPYTVAMPTGFSQACQINPIASVITNMSFLWDGTTAQMLTCHTSAGPSIDTQVAAPSGTPATATVWMWSDSTQAAPRAENPAGVFFAYAKELASGNIRKAGGANAVDSAAAITDILALATGTCNTTTLLHGGGACGAVVLADTAAVSTATASTLVSRDASANISADAFLTGFTTTATAAGTTTLTVDSTEQQYFTGSTTQTVALPVATTLVNGQRFRIVNNSTGLVTIQTSGGNTLLILAGSTTAWVTCVNTGGGTGTASWSANNYDGIVITSGKALTVTGSMTQSVTDGSTVAFGGGGTVLYNAGALGTPSSGTGTNITGIPNNNVLAANLPTPGTSITLVAPRSYGVCTGTCTVTVPVPAAGNEFCIMNDDNVATAITLSALGSSAMYENSARTAYGTAGTGTLVIAAAAKNKVCILGRDSTHYLTVANDGGAITVN